MAEPRKLPVVRGLTATAELFETGFTSGNGPHACNSKCCARGAYVDLAERDRVLAHAELIKPHMDETQSRDERDWFETETLADPDYPSGRCVGTAVRNDKCALLDARGYCSLQVAAGAAGMHKWALKPLYCALFPIEVQAGVVRLDGRHFGVHACCSAQAPFDVSAFEACREELVHLLGEADWRAMRAASARGPRV
jgi:Protein of unknown function (DUF3109)